MKQPQSFSDRPSLGWVLLPCIGFTAVGLIFFSNQFKVLTLLASLAILAMLLFCHLTYLRNPAALCLLSYVAISGLTALWAISGKFYLREFSKILVACAIFMAILLIKRMDRWALTAILFLLAGMSAIFAFLSVEAASTGVTPQVIYTLLPGLSGVPMGFEEGIRLTGIFGNANMFASVLAIGIFASLALLEGTQGRVQMVASALLSLNAFAFLLAFSLGGMVSLALAVLVYLIFAGPRRGASLIQMVAAALPTLAFAFLAFPFFPPEGRILWVPLLAMGLNAAAVVILEWKVVPPLVLRLEGKQRLTLAILLAVLVAALLYAVAGYHLSGPYTFQGGEELRRSAYPEPGVHTLSIQSNQDVEVVILSQNDSEIMMHQNTILYQGSAQQASFTVPQDSKVCYFTFSAPAGTVLQKAQLDGTTSIRLDYTLLPGFIANRIQGLWANQNAIQRTVFFRDGWKMFLQSPLIGNGVGSFETGVTSVQDFYYQTRYIHNHYIQVLLESGLLGFLAFLGALAGMIWLLWKRRKEEEAWPFRWAYPALWAGLVMIMAHGTIEVSLSMIIFLSFAFCIFGLIIRTCAPEPKSWGRYELPGRLVAALFPSLFAISLLGNMLAHQVVRTQAATPAQFFRNLDLAIFLDPYEDNDAKLAYLNNTLNLDAETYLPKANAYAKEMMKVHSNSIPQFLVDFYLYTGQYALATQAANQAAAYSASNPAAWNNVLSSLRGFFVDRLSQAPELYGDQQAVENLLTYYQTLQKRNSTSLEPIALTLENQDFLSKFLYITQENLSPESIDLELRTRLFSSRHGCDSNSDGIHDQLSHLSGVAPLEAGALAFESGGTVTWNVYTLEFGTGQLVIQADQPQELQLREPLSNTLFTPDRLEGTQAIYTIPLNLAYDLTLTLELSSAVPQTVQQIDLSLVS